jgi:hypothetical protein
MHPTARNIRSFCPCPRDTESGRVSLETTASNVRSTTTSMYWSSTVARGTDVVSSPSHVLILHRILDARAPKFEWRQLHRMVFGPRGIPSRPSLEICHWQCQVHWISCALAHPSIYGPSFDPFYVRCHPDIILVATCPALV